MHFWNNLKAVSSSVPLSWSHCQSDSFIISFSYLEHIVFSHFWQKNLHNQPGKTNRSEKTGNLVLELRNTLKLYLHTSRERQALKASSSQSAVIGVPVECISMLTVMSETLKQCQNLVYLGNGTHSIYKESNKEVAAAVICLTALEVREFLGIIASCVQRLFLSS